MRGALGVPDAPHSRPLLLPHGAHYAFYHIKGDDEVALSEYVQPLEATRAHACAEAEGPGSGGPGGSVGRQLTGIRSPTRALRGGGWHRWQ